MKVQVSTALLLLAHTAFGLTSITVPGTADLWLAGMPDGSTASISDSAPGQSPVLVTGISVMGGAVFSFQASGLVSHGPGLDLAGPDGSSITQFGTISHWVSLNVAGAENGIGNITAPWNSLIGLFLGPDRPDLTPTPSALDFSTQMSLDYLTLAPQLKQPFFIGDGLTSQGDAQQITAPAGATRLFLGTMDNYGWSNNGGFFITVIPEPSAGVLLFAALTTWCLGRFRRM